jgi:hypothetical protein
MTVLSCSAHLKGFMGEEMEENLPSDNILDRLNGSMQNIRISVKAADVTIECLQYSVVMFEIDIKRV